MTKVAKRKVSHQLFIKSQFGSLNVAGEGSKVKKGHQKGLKVSVYLPDEEDFLSGFYCLNGFSRRLKHTQGPKLLNCFHQDENSCW